MRTYSSLSVLCLLAATGRSLAESHLKIYPTVFRTEGFNSTEHELGLGVMPLAPLGNVQMSNIWGTPLVSNCPQLCSAVGPDLTNWTHIHAQADLVRCEQPILFDLGIHNEYSIHSTIRACAASTENIQIKSADLIPRNTRHRNETAKPVYGPDLEAIAASIASSDSCGAQRSFVHAVFTAGPAILRNGSDAASAVGLLASYLENVASCGTRIIFAKLGSAVVGLYAGAELNSGSASRHVRGFRKSLQPSLSLDFLLALSRANLNSTSFDSTTETNHHLCPGDTFKRGVQTVQTCAAGARNAQTLGLFAVDDVDDLGRAQAALKSWATSGCVDTDSAEVLGEAVELDIFVATQSESSFNHTTPTPIPGISRFFNALAASGECRAIQVAAGDNCASLASRCAIRGNDFLKYNPRTDLCSNLMPKQWVCCSEGNLPDKRPKTQPDGTCATHAIAPGDTCFAIADNYRVKQSDINKWNKNTWGWAGCTRLQPGQIICLSRGNTPMPAPVNGVVCGPQKPGTKAPSGEFDGRDLAKLNQCPLNACCSGWGFCGTTDEFCTESPADTGAPGAFKPGTNGCISNCGTEIVNNKVKPSSFARVGYFQAYNGARDCLRMDATEIADGFDDLTHVHFAFAGITEDFDVHIKENIREQFDKFIDMEAPFKKVLSFGGWAESTEPETYQRYRDAVKPTNRQRLAENVLKFVNSHNLDGVDFDWEYPGATDQGIPPSQAIDAENYLRFLTTLRTMLPDTGEISLSIALPASFWYLKPFPVRAMSSVVDYFIYMTYDLHGQWDYSNKFANPGCPNGNCLRSHINRTETHTALSMITKAGVPAYKIYVGITSYGRSFRMSDPSCVGPMCTFTGSPKDSEAEPGQCTGTGGYIANAELEEIYQNAKNGTEGFQARRWHDTETDSDIMVWFVLQSYIGDSYTDAFMQYVLYGTYGQGMTDWVAYMDDETKTKRIDWIRDLNFGGTTDWAVDLDGWFRGPPVKGGYTVESDDLSCDSDSWPNTLESLEADVGTVPVHCRGMALLYILVKDLNHAITEYNMVSKDFDEKFGWYAEWVKDAINARLDEFMAIGKGEGLKYMDCKWKTKMTEGEGRCTEVNLIHRGGSNAGPRVVEFTMRDEDGFYEALLEHTGIKKDWIKWVEKSQKDDPCPQCPVKFDCPPRYCADDYYLRKNFPRRIDDQNKIEVDNPKKIVEEALPNLGRLSNIAMATFFEMRMGILDADSADVVTAFSMPTFMLQDAYKSIKEIKEIGKEHKEAKTRNLVLTILSIVFAVIPFAGLAAQAVGIATRLATAALIVGEAGNVALTIAEVLDNPTSAPFAILGLLIGAGGIQARGPRKAFGDAANVRRALDASALKSFSDEFIRKDSLVQKIVKSCVR